MGGATAMSNEGKAITALNALKNKDDSVTAAASIITPGVAYATADLAWAAIVAARAGNTLLVAITGATTATKFKALADAVRAAAAPKDKTAAELAAEAAAATAAEEAKRAASAAAERAKVTEAADALQKDISLASVAVMTDSALKAMPGWQLAVTIATTPTSSSGTRARTRTRTGARRA